MTEENNKKNSTQTLEITRVDLGDDLLEQTRTAESFDSQTEHSESLDAWLPPHETIHSQFESAKILINEGLLEQAKKILHRIMIQEPDYLIARDTLHQIHEEELKQIFSDKRVRNKYRRSALDFDKDMLNVDTDSILRKLDRELSLGLTHDSSSSSLSAYFQDPHKTQRFLGDLDLLYAKGTLQDRIDLGIGFLEMELYNLSIHQFQTAVKIAMQGISDNPESNGKSYQEILVSVCLLATALLLAGKAFDAVLTLQMVLNDHEIPRESKIELFYLMARANHVLNKTETALYWVEQAENLDPTYRDLQSLKHRLRKT